MPGTPYLIVDHLGRILMPAEISDASWQWAFMGSYDDYPGNVVGVSFSSDPTKGAAVLSLGSPKTNLSLYAKGSATSWEYVFFGNSTWSSYSLIYATAVSDGQGSFTLRYQNGTTQMALCAQSSSWRARAVRSDCTAVQSSTSCAAERS